MTGAQLLSVRGIGRRFGGVVALEDVTFNVRAGEILGLIGPNGAGKTTLINVASGFERPSAGTIALGGDSSGPWSVEAAVERGIVRTFQTPRGFLGLTVAENLEIASASPRASREANSSTDNLDVAAELELEPWLDQRVSDLPYGPLRRLSIALALCTRPRLVLLDEPGAGLTEPELQQLSAVIERLTALGLTTVLVEHNIAFLMGLVHRVVVLHQGRVLFEGSPHECRRNPQVQQVYLGHSA